MIVPVSSDRDTATCFKSCTTLPPELIAFVQDKHFKKYVRIRFLHLPSFKNDMGKIIVEGIKMYAYHGCMQEESVVGGNYIVDVIIDTDLNKPSKSDQLSDTIDYVAVYEVVKKEMSIRSKLIEHVAKRIIDSLKKKFSKTISIEVKVTKLNPPIKGVVEKVSAVLSE